DARDGELLWARHVARPQEGETITMAPLIHDGLVVIGPAGSENSIKGWIGAFRLADGTPVWRFNTVPKPGEPGADTWANPRGLPRNVVATVGKAGVLTVLDRDTHERVYEGPITTRLNADAAVGRKPVRVCPGMHGGVEWNGPAYSPRAHLLYVPAVDWCGIFQAGRTALYAPGDEYIGGAYT